jgi:hypothetical protein
VPGLVSSRPDVGGTSGGLQGGMTARGTPNAQNSQFLNGINVGDPAAIGFSGYYYDYDAFEEIQVSTGAHDISVPTSGVFLNMVTKSGTDRTGQAVVFWEGDSTQTQNVDARFSPASAETNQVDFVSDLTRRSAVRWSRTRLASSPASATGACTSTRRPPSPRRCSTRPT